MAVTLNILQSFGTCPVSRLLWKIATSYGATSCANSLITLAGMESGPYALAGFSFKSSFRTPSSVTLISAMGGNGVPSGVGMS